MNPLSSEFMQYLASYQNFDTDGDQGETARLPSLNNLSKEMGVSVACLREQLEVAKAIGLVEVRPRTGIRRLPYTFLPAVRQSLSYAIAIDWQNFMAFADLRNHLEAAYWEEAASKLNTQDQQFLQKLITDAWEKLRGNPIQIPHIEHRQLHICIYSRLGNSFVQGLLEAYWEAYEEVGLNLYADYDYLNKVWDYHKQMVDAICEDDLPMGYKALVEHRDLLFHRPKPLPERRNETV